MYGPPYTITYWAPLAFSIMFGLTFSLTVTLILVPILYNRKPGVLAEESIEQTPNNSIVTKTS